MSDAMARERLSGVGRADVRRRPSGRSLLGSGGPVHTEDWPRCGCGPGETIYKKLRMYDVLPWWWCLRCGLPVGRVGEL